MRRKQNENTAPPRVVRCFLRSDLTSGEAIRLILVLEDPEAKNRGAGCMAEVSSLNPTQEGRWKRRLIQWRIRDIRKR